MALLATNERRWYLVMVTPLRLGEVSNKQLAPRGRSGYCVLNDGILSSASIVVSADQWFGSLGNCS
jgi:hypothetical protein